MAGTTQFPGALDAFPEIGPNTSEAAEGAEHDVVHENVHAAMRAVQVRLGVTGSTDPSSVEARLANTATAAQGALADSALQPGAIGVTVQGWSAVLAATTASFSLAQETKLGGIAAGATANSADATLLARVNHTGSQLASTVSDFAVTVRATLLTGLSLATSTAVAATDTLLVAIGKLQAQVAQRALAARTITTTAPLAGGGDLTANRTLSIAAATTAAAGSMSAADKAKLDGIATPKGYIDGHTMQWVSGIALTVTSGSAYIESVGSIVTAPDIAKSGLTLAASTWHHVYRYDNAGTPDLDISTTAPAAPYHGTARSKTGDNTRRYVGSIKTDAAGSIFNFQQAGNYIGYKHDHGNAPFRALAGGTATAETTVSLAAVVPATARMTQLYLINLSNYIMGTGTPDDSAGGPPYAAVALIGEQTRIIVTHPLDASQQVTYWLTSTGGALSGSAYLDVYGYHFER